MWQSAGAQKFIKKVIYTFKNFYIQILCGPIFRPKNFLRKFSQVEKISGRKNFPIKIFKV